MSPDVNVISCLVWNYEETLKILHRHPSASAVLCGAPLVRVDVRAVPLLVL